MRDNHWPQWNALSSMDKRVGGWGLVGGWRMVGGWVRFGDIGVYCITIFWQDNYIEYFYIINYLGKKLTARIF